MRTLFYCQHSLGVGHLMRVLHLADAFTKFGKTCVISGGEVPHALAVNPDIRLEKLPPLEMNANGQLENNQCSTVPHFVLGQRRELARRIAADFKPDTLIVEMFPFGRKKFHDEITSLIRHVRRNPKSRILCSVRDILVTKRRDQRRHDLRAARWLNEYFDALLVHSDAGFVRLEETFSAHSDIEIPIHYTGYVSRPAVSASGKRKPRIVVSAGGGRVGHRLLKVARDAFAEVKAATSLDMLIIAGPLADAGFGRGAGGSGLTVVPYVADLPGTLARSQLSISQCGYNTFTDILRARVPAILVPFEAEFENEQYHRARLLRESGRAALLRERDLTVDSLIAGVTRMAADRTECPIDLEGVTESRRIVNEMYAHG